MPRFVRLVVLLALTACGSTQRIDQPPALDAIREADLEADLYALAGDHFRGREAGTLDELRASAWLAERARDAGLQPAGEDGTYFQWWSIVRSRLSSSASIAVGGTPIELHSGAIVITPSPTTIDAPLVDGGDGRSLGNADLRGKAVLVRITKPDADIPDDVSVRAARYVWAAAGETVARLAANRPAAIVLLSDPVADSAWSFLSAWFRNGTYGIEPGAANPGPAPPAPVIWVRGAAAGAVQPGARLRASLVYDRFTQPSVNVVAKVPGTDPGVRGEYVLFSAHQDHDGVKAPVAGDSIWNGADDNGSVSVGILAIGRAFVKRPARRSALFVWHGAEEKGLLGSRYHAEHPVVPGDSIVAVLNGDMIGSNHPDTAALLGTQPPHRNSPELVAMGLRANELVSGFVIDSSWDRPTHPEGWYFRSDHVPYARKGIPSLYFSSLPHPLYHTERDEPASINYPKLAKIARWMYATGWLVANADHRPGLEPPPSDSAP